jgi:hypothetical protein
MMRQLGTIPGEKRMKAEAVRHLASAFGPHLRAIVFAACALTGCDKATGPVVATRMNTVVTAAAVYNGPSCAAQPLGIVTWLPANGDAHDIIGTNNGALTHGASYGPGRVDQAFSFDGTTSSVLLSQSVQSTPPLPNVSDVGSMSFEFWIKVDAYTSGGIHDGTGSYFIDRLVSARPGAENPVFSLKAVGGQFALQVRYDDLTGLGGPIGGGIVTGQWMHVAMVREYGVAFHLYLDGSLVASHADNGRQLHLETTKLGHHYESALLGYVGLMDEFGIYSRALSQNEIQAIVAAGSNGKCNCPLTTISAQPASITRSVGDAASFSVTATGPAPSYQWKKDGVDIPAATGASYSIASVQPGDAGDYTAVVTECGSVTSASATLSVNKVDQTISFAPLPNTTYGAAPFMLSAAATSGLAVSFVASGTCTIAVNSVATTGAGSCTITASQAGDANYNPAPNVVQTLAIAKAQQFIAFPAIADHLSDDPPFAIGATGGASGQPVTFSSVGSCTVSGNILTIAGPGNCTITASQAGDANYDPAATVQRTFAIAMKVVSVTIDFFPFNSSLTNTAVYNRVRPLLSTPIVAVLFGSATFQPALPGTRAITVQVSSVRLGATSVATVSGNYLVTVVDVNRDGRLDVVFTFRTDQLVANGDLSTTLTTPQPLVLSGAHSDGRRFAGTDHTYLIVR